MTATLTIAQAGPLLTLQDLGRPGHIGVGLSPGGAMDRLALFEATALLGLPAVGTAIEMAGTGGRFRCDAPVRFALTGARMTAHIDGAAVRWNATHSLQPDQTLTIGGAVAGTYGYLSVAGGIVQGLWLDSTAAHLSVGIGRVLVAGDTLTIGADPHPNGPHRGLSPDDRLSGGVVRVMPGLQTQQFDEATRARLATTIFRRNARSNRTGLLLDHDGAGFVAHDRRSPVSDFITCGDIQMTGDGTPFVLLAECQTIGGYPRIGTVIAADRPRVAQTPAGATLRLTWVTSAEADDLFRTVAQSLAQLRANVQPLLRNPADLPDLLSYQLISGVTAGDELEPAK